MKLSRWISPSLVLALSLATVASGCGGATEPSVSGTAPLRAFRGRTVDVLLSGSGTRWDDSAQVSFGDGVTVNKVTAASPTALVANITVASTATLGPRDITVTQGDDSSPYKMAFLIESAIDVQVQGTASQGSLVFVTIENHDFDHLFDDTSEGDGLFSPIVYTNIDIKAPTGTTVTIGNVTPFRIDATLLLDTTVAAGAFDLELKSGPTGGSRDSFDYPAALTIASRTAEPLTSTAAVEIANAYGSHLYTLTQGGADHYVSISVASGDPDTFPSVIVLGKSGAFADLIKNGAAVSWLTENADPVYVIVYDTGGVAGYTADVTSSDLLLTTQAGGEGDNTLNNAASTPVVLSTPPVRVKDASLSNVNDVDWYKVTVPAGKRIRAQTIAGDDADTTIAFFQADGITAIGEVVDRANGENALSPALPGAGDYLIKIAASVQYFDPSAPGYDLVVTLE